MFGGLQIEIDQLVNSAAVQQTQHFRNRKTGGDGTHERRTDGLARQKRNATAIQLAGF